MIEKYAYWYCHNCKKELADLSVTYEEKCDFCGHPVEWIEGEIPTHETPDQYKARTGKDYPDDEIWRDVLGYEGLYKITNTGGIKSCKKGKKLIWQKQKSGHESIILYKNGKGTRFMKHRLLYLVFIDSEINDMHIDHIDRNPENNDLSNLRVVSRSQNMMNCKSYSGSSIFKGVHYDSKRNKWYAQIKKDQESIFLGRFKTEKEAAEAYDKKAIEIFGEYANTNKDMELYGKPDKNWRPE